MNEKIRSVQPKFSMFGLPVWHHHHSRKIDVEHVPESSNGNVVKLSANATELVITSNLPNPGHTVEYVIKHGGSSETHGRVWMGQSDLCTAFCISNVCYADGGGQHLLDRFGGDVAVQGRYIRFGPCLNIPGPGTGHDGDPNISVYVTDEIQEAVRSFLFLLNRQMGSCSICYKSFERSDMLSGEVKESSKGLAHRDCYFKAIDQEVERITARIRVRDFSRDEPHPALPDGKPEDDDQPGGLIV